MSEEKEERRGPGPPLGRANHAKKQPWPEDMQLDSPEAILRFQKQVVQDLYTGKLGGRQGGCINHALENLLKSTVCSGKSDQLDALVRAVLTMHS